MWGWRSSSTEPPPPPPGAVPRTGSRTPTETGRNGRRWPRLDWAEPPRPDRAPGRRRAARWAWRVGTRTPRSQTSSPNRKHRRPHVSQSEGLVSWRSARVFSHHSPSLTALCPLERAQLEKFNRGLPLTADFQNNCSLVWFREIVFFVVVF